MTSIITELIRQTIRSPGAGTFATTSGILIVLLLIVLLVQKEFSRSLGGPRSPAWGQALNIAIVPLLLAFLVIVADRFL
jgi:hypothetical protein